MPERGITQHVLTAPVSQRDHPADPALLHLLGGLHQQVQLTVDLTAASTRTPLTPNITAAVRHPPSLQPISPGPSSDPLLGRPRILKAPAHTPQPPYLGASRTTLSDEEPSTVASRRR